MCASSQEEIRDFFVVCCYSYFRLILHVLITIQTI
jgi:hypothetical protein